MKNENLIKYWAYICENQDADSAIAAGEKTNTQPNPEVEQVKADNANAEAAHTVEPTPEENAQQDGEVNNESEGPVHYAIVANIKNGLFKKDDSVFVCHVGSSDQEGNVTSTERLQENDGAKMCWDGKNDMEFGGYKPNEDNDWDYLLCFAKCGKNQEILDRVKDHYGPRFRNFSIREYYPKDTDTFIDHIDPAMMKGLCPYCR